MQAKVKYTQKDKDAVSTRVWREYGNSLHRGLAPSSSGMGLALLTIAVVRPDRHATDPSDSATATRLMSSEDAASITCTPAGMLASPAGKGTLAAWPGTRGGVGQGRGW